MALAYRDTVPYMTFRDVFVYAHRVAQTYILSTLRVYPPRFRVRFTTLGVAVHRALGFEKSSEQGFESADRKRFPKRGGSGSASVSTSRKLTLFISGCTPRAKIAVENLNRILETYTKGRCALEIVDLRNHPGRATEDGIVAIPTLVVKTAGKDLQIIGDFSDTSRVLAALRINL